MPTAKKLPSGSWRCQVYSHTDELIQPDGSIKKKRIYKSFTCDIKGPKGKRIAEKMAAEWAEEKENQGKIYDITFGEALDRYIAGREAVLSPRTIMDYKRTRKKSIQSLMDKNLQRITQDDIQKAVNLEAQGHSPKTVRNIHGLISAVMRIYRPGFALNTSLPQKVRPKLYIPSDAEVKRLLEAVADTPMEVPILLAAFGPMRRGEICALDASDITGNIVHVNKNMVKTESGDWIIKSPKSYAGDRYIEFPDFVIRKLNTVGAITTLTPNNITDKFHRILKRAGLPHFRFHDLRHYSASIQHALGIPDIYIAQRGGWGNMSTLNSIYKHAMEDKALDMGRVANQHFSELCNTKYNTT
ncbi:MAG: site-specific integrase [Clostridiales bacterium]|nr:site-specific integrase [Clostridiales bacterium]